MVEGVSGSGGAPARPAAAMDTHAAACWNGRTARWRRCSRRKIRKACAARSFPPPGCDELAKWRHAEATFDMLQFGLRLGERPRQVVTTTPRPIALLKPLMADPRTAVTHAGTLANAYNLAPAFVETVLARYRGTRLGRQEIDGEMIEERADALWTRARSKRAASTRRRRLRRIVVAVDPPGSARKGADACGLVAAGRADDGAIYVLADDSAAACRRRAGRRRRSRCGAGSRPTRWWRKSISAATWCAR